MEQEMKLINEIRQYCIAHYNEGYDVVVEAYGNDELQEFIDDFNVTSVKSFVVEFAFMIDHRAEMASTEF